MRISDWSSDVCSSDLVRRIILAVARVGLVFAIVEIIDRIIGVIFGRVAVAERGFPLRIMASLKVEADEQAAGADRSEEHTSELQSIMRNSYAVFCWKKTTHTRAHRQQQSKRKTQE